MEYNYNKSAMQRTIAGILDSNLLLVGGNGGSAEQSSHFVAELTGSFEGKMNSYPAISMCTNTAELTAFANDFGYENIFVRYFDVFKIFKPALLLISTSGKSKNVNKLIDLCLSNGYTGNKITLLTGKNDVNGYKNNINVITVDYDDTATIQEAHMHILHNIASIIKHKTI